MHKQLKLFIIGNPRSGTSLLRIMLNSNNSIVVPPECGYIQWWYFKYKDWPVGGNLQNFIDDLRTSKKIETWQLDYKLLYEYLKENQPESYQSLIFKVIEFYGFSKHNKFKTDVLGDKNNYYINHLEQLKQIAPKAKFIFIVRDPRDVYCSYKGIAKLNSASAYVPNLPQDLDGFIKSWNQNQKQIIEFIKELNWSNYHILNYEDLVSNTQFELKEICNFLEVNFTDEMLSYYTSNDEPQDLLDWKKKTLKPPDVSSIGQYSKLLQIDEIQKIVSKTFDTYTSLKTFN